MCLGRGRPLTGAEIEGTLGVTKLGHVKVLTKGILALRSRAANAD